MSRQILVDAADPSDELETEVEQTEADPQESTGVEAEASQPKPAARPVPKKLEGKTFEDVVDMYVHLEKELGRQANEIGVYRDLVSTLGDTKRRKDLAEAEKQDSAIEVTSDDLFESPRAAIEKVVKGALEKELAPLKQSQATSEKQKQLERLVADYPNLEEVGADPNFVAFVERSPYRLADAQRWLETQDVDAARRLLSDWTDLSGSSRTIQAEEPQTEKPPRGNVKAARKAATESGGNAGTVRKVMTKAEVMKVIQTDPDRYYSEAFQQQLADAIREGRFKS